MRRLAGGWIEQCRSEPGNPGETRRGFGYPNLGGQGCSGAVGLDGQGWYDPGWSQAAWNNATYMLEGSVYPFLSFERAKIVAGYWRPAPEPFNPANPYIYPGIVQPWMPDVRSPPAINPNSLPSMFPALAPLVRPAESPEPVPFKAIPRFNRSARSNPALMPRQSGYHAPWLSPGSSLQPGFYIGRVPAETVMTATGVAARPSTYRQEKPPAGVKERKFIAHRAGVARAIWLAAHTATESMDFIREIWKAIPKEHRTRRAKPHEQLLDLWNHFDQVNWDQAWRNVVINEFQDFAIGGTSRLMNSRTEAMFGSRYIGQGLGTKMNHAFGDNQPDGGSHASMSPFGAAGEFAEGFGGWLFGTTR